MGWLSDKDIRNLGFARTGRDVKISDKASIYDARQIEIGDFSRIDDFCVISGKVRVGRNVHIAVFSNVAGGEPGVTLEDFAGLAYSCHVFAQSDDYSGATLTNPTVPDVYKHETKAAVTVRRHVIVGAQSIVMPGVDIAEGCAVGAHTIVTRSTEPWGVYLGAPARRIKERKRDLLKLEAAYLGSAGS